MQGADRRRQSATRHVRRLALWEARTTPDVSVDVLFLLGPLFGIIAGVLALRWALGSHRKDRAPWVRLLADASPGTHAVDGIADDGGAIEPIDAPFSGRKCMAFHIEIIVQEQFGNSTSWTRAFEDGVGHFFVAAPDGRRADVDFAGGQMILPPDLTDYRKITMSEKQGTIFEGTIDRAPPHLGWFVQRLPQDAQHIVLRASRQLIGGKRLYFNERIVVPGDKVVLAGAARDEGDTFKVASSQSQSVSLGFGDLASERSRVAKLPVAGEAFGAVIAGVIALALVEMIVAMTTS
jgi:hypothetical protein